MLFSLLSISSYFQLRKFEKQTRPSFQFLVCFLTYTKTLEEENVGQIIESFISLLTVVEVTPNNKINKINYI